MPAAIGLAEKGLRRYPSEQSEWYWKFLGIKAHGWTLQGKFTEALGLLNRPLPSQFKDADFAVRLKLTQALSLANTQRGTEAAVAIGEAEALGQAKYHELLGEVALRKGTVCFIAGDFVCAGSEYRAALQSARERHDSYFEAAALNGLGIVATRLEHYDEAVEWDRAALKVAQSAGARYSVAQILGNTAWCYRKLGDYENALALYKQAEEDSRQAKLTAEQIYWIAAISDAYYEQRQLTQAKEYLERGLSLAREQDDKTILMQYLNALAAIALDEGQPDRAATHLAEARNNSGEAVDATIALDQAIIDGRIKQEREKRIIDVHKLPSQSKSYGDANSIESLQELR